MKAVILAAGRGKRLQPFTDRHPKCLLEFGGKSLLRRHLENLRAAGIEEITVVIGHLAEQVAAEVAASACPAPVRLVLNSSYEGGSAVSLLAAAEAFSGYPSLILDADILCSGTVFQRLVAAPFHNCLLVDGALDDSGEEVKVVVSGDGRVCELGKRLAGNGRVAGESVGIFKFGSAAGKALADRLRSAVSQNPELEYEPVIDALVKEVRTECVAVDDLPWVEIDFWEDVERARAEVYPRIEADEARAAARANPA